MYSKNDTNILDYLKNFENINLDKNIMLKKLSEEMEEP